MFYDFKIMYLFTIFIEFMWNTCGIHMKFDLEYYYFFIP